MTGPKFTFGLQLDNEGRILMPGRDEVTNVLGDLGNLDLFAESATQKLPLGSKVVQGDRVFRYAKCGGTGIGIGKLVTGAASGADHIIDLAVAAAAAVGDLSITITNGATTAITANMFAGGYVFMNDCGAGTGEGQILRIKSHPAAGTTASCVLTLYDPVKVACTTAAQCGIKKNPYDAVVISATTPVAVPLGVTTIALTANYYGFVQTGGPVAVLTNGTVIVGKKCVVGLSVAGSVDVAPLNSVDASGQEPTVGIVMSVAAGTEYSLVYLLLDR